MAQVMRQHVRLWWRFLVQAVVRDTHYRVHFLAIAGVGVAQLVFALVPVLLLYGYTDEVNGWSGAEVIALVGLHQLVVGLLATFVAPNMTRMTQYIVHGDLDLVLLRPVSSQFSVTLRWIQPAELTNAATGALVLAAGLYRAGIAPEAADIAQAVLLLGCGLVLLTCVWSALTYLAFWLTSVQPIPMLVVDLARVGQYPVSFFPTAIRTLLIFVFPVAFATTFPIQALTGAASWSMVFGGLALTAVAMVLLRLYWRFALRHYSSASS